jgi:hypothetical protein
MSCFDRNDRPVGGLQACLIFEHSFLGILVPARNRQPVARAVLFSAPMNSTENTTDQAVESSLAKGVLGALLGAAVGVGVMFAFYTFAGFRFPLLGVGIGILTAYGARMLYKGGDNTLGLIASGIALSAVVATLYLMYGEFPIMNIISVIVSASLAYRIGAK